MEKVILIDSVTMSDLAAIFPIFIMIAIVIISGYLVPVILGKVDDRKTEKIEKAEKLLQ